MLKTRDYKLESTKSLRTKSERPLLMERLPLSRHLKQSKQNKENKMEIAKRSVFCPRMNFSYMIKALKMFKYIDRSLPYSQEPMDLSKLSGEKRTLVLDLDKTLVFSQTVSVPFGEADPNSMNKAPNHVPWVTIWSEADQKNCLTHHLQLYIRPHIFWFLEEMIKYYDLVLFTAADKTYATRVLRIIDPAHKYFKYRLYRENCTMYPEAGVAIKDLRAFAQYKNIMDVIIVDDLVTSFALQINNGIPISPFEGDAYDFQLKMLGSYLRSLKKEQDVTTKIKNDFCVEKLLSTIGYY